MRALRAGALALGLALAPAAAPAAESNQPYGALPPSACTQLATAVQHTLRKTLPVSATTAHLKQNPRNISSACRINVRGATAADYPNMFALFAPIDKLLTAQGYVRNIMLDADGPTGMVRVYYGKPSKIVEVDITQALTAGSCPGNEPIASCFEAAPKTSIGYTLRLDAAQK